MRRIVAEGFEADLRLARVRRHLESRIEHPLSLAAAARVARVSRKYFSALFRVKIGIRFTEWVHLTRIERAMGLIESSRLSIAEVAALVGYEDTRTFQRAFKRVAGVSARTFRKNARAQQRERTRYRARPDSRGDLARPGVESP